MKRFEIKYTETYCDTYEVEAENYEEARKKLEEMIRNGEEDGPEQCDDSGYEFVGEYDIE